MASAAAEPPAPIFISVVKREFRHPYTAATKAAVLEEAQELIRTCFLLIDMSVLPRNLREPGSISFEIEEMPAEYIVRVRGVPRLVEYAGQVFDIIEGWAETEKRVTLKVATTERPIASRSTNAYRAERARASAASAGPVAAGNAGAVFVGAAGNRPGLPLKYARRTNRAVRTNLGEFAATRGLTLPVAKAIWPLWKEVRAEYLAAGSQQIEADVLADNRLGVLRR